MNTKNTMKVISLVLIGILMYSCHNDEDFIENMESKTKETESTYSFGEKIILGKQLENPFSVENMKRAYAEMQKSKSFSLSKKSNLKISTTHHYVKFILKDSLDLRKIEADTTLIAYDYPLDYEILQMGDYYHDPEVPKDRPTYHYASVELGQALPRGVDHEILSDLHIPDPEDIGEDVADFLEDIALELTDNLEDEAVSTTNRRRKWRPAGTIKVWDDVIGTTRTRVFSHWEYYDCDEDGNNVVQKDNPPKITEQCRRAVYVYVDTPGSYIPMQGVKVRARRWFTTHTGITNAQGYFSCDGRFRRPANYKIKWKRHNFSIWWSWLSSAKYNGPKKKGNWNLNIRGGHQGYYATIFRAAHLYYYGNIYGLHRPPERTFVGGRLIINAKKLNDRSSYSHERSIVFGADILLKKWGEPTGIVFGTTIHELAHAAHRRMDKAAYAKLKWDGYTSPWLSLGETWQNPGPTGRNAKRLMETWATTVEHYLVRRHYHEVYGATGYTYIQDFFQRRTIAQNNFYTSCGIDMLDDINQRLDIFPLNPNRPFDRVEGYTINQLENAMRGACTWHQWRDNLRNTYDNDTEEFLNELFANWTN